MDDRRWSIEPVLITGFGSILFLVAVVHHGLELAALNGLPGPLLALALDGIPAIAIAYAGYRLSGTDLSARYRRIITIWAFGGGVIFVVVIGASFLVRFIEERPIIEWQFPLLISAEIGVLSGLLAGYYYVRAQTEADEARAVSKALEFVNNLLRHDLRNDLITIQGQAELIGLDDQDGVVQSADLSVITDKADEALTRIEMTRTVAETVAGDPELQSVDLVSTTTDMVESTENVYDVSIECNLPDTAFVKANDGLWSVVDNLLENAIEHNDTDDPQVTVEIDRDSAAETVRLTVRDNGPGIPEQQKERLLTANGGEVLGGGLGIVKSLVESYDGDLRFQDNQPRGSVFIVELPEAESGPRGHEIDYDPAD